jgi:hypothetical protein
MLLAVLVHFLNAGGCQDGGLEAFWGSTSKGCYTSVWLESEDWGGTQYCWFKGSFVAKESGSHNIETWRDAYWTSGDVEVQLWLDDVAGGWSYGKGHSYSLTVDYRYKVKEGIEDDRYWIRIALNVAYGSRSLGRMNTGNDKPRCCESSGCDNTDYEQRFQCKPSPSISKSPSPTASRSKTPSPTASRSKTPSPTASISRTPSPTASLSHTPSPTMSRSHTPSPTRSHTPSPTHSHTPTSTPSIEFKHSGMFPTTGTMTASQHFEKSSKVTSSIGCRASEIAVTINIERTPHFGDTAILTASMSLIRSIYCPDTQPVDVSSLLPQTVIAPTNKLRQSPEFVVSKGSTGSQRLQFQNTQSWADSNVQILSNLKATKACEGTEIERTESLIASKMPRASSVFIESVANEPSSVFAVSGTYAMSCQFDLTDNPRSSIFTYSGIVDQTLPLHNSQNVDNSVDYTASNNLIGSSFLDSNPQSQSQRFGQSIIIDKSSTLDITNRYHSSIAGAGTTDFA